MDNTGGLYKIYVCPAAQVRPDGTVTDLKLLSEVVFICDTGSRKCVRKTDKNGTFYELTITCKLARSDRESLTAGFPPAIALVTTDNNGVTRVDGNIDEPIRWESDSDTGEDFEDLNGVDLKFSRKLRFLSPVVSL